MFAAMGATLVCTFGTAPGQLSGVTSQAQTIAGGAPIATINDTAPIVNIAPFGNCTTLSNPTVASATAAALGVLTPMPCVPNIAGKWVVPKIVNVGGQPGLTTDGVCACSWGGTISVKAPAQSKVML